MPYTAPAGTKLVSEPVVYSVPPSLPGLATTPPTVTTPSFPATGSAVTNATGVNVIAWLSGGTFTSVVLNGGTVATGACNPVIVPASQTIQFAYTGSPSWVWTAF